MAGLVARLEAGLRDPRLAAREASKRGRAVILRIPGKKICYQCQKHVLGFMPARGFPSPADRVLKVIGSRPDAFLCPSCFCHDRERHLLMYLDHFEWRHDLSGVDVLHFAPERYLGAKFRRQSKTYTASNFDPKTPGQGIDICSIPFPDRSFDLVVANHVLEHVPNDRQAMAEICRVLRPGGVAILQTPYTPVLTHSLENPEIKDEAARAVVFGQSDHVRIYGLDLFHRLNKAGLRVTLFRHADVLKHFDSEVWGVNPLEPLIAVRRVQGSDGHGTI